MSKGRPDWSEKGLTQNTASLYDMAELAVRLGSGVIYDRSGRVLFYDDFSRLDGLWTITDVGVSSATALNNSILEFGSNALKGILNIGTGNYVDIVRQFRLFTETRLSIETAFYSDNLPNALSLTFYIYTASIRYQGVILFSGSSGEISYLDDAAAYQKIDDFDTAIFGSSYFSNLKVDIDNENFEYIRFKFNELEYDLSGLGLYQFAGSFQPSLYADLKINGHGTNQLTFYLDRFIFSEDI